MRYRLSLVPVGTETDGKAKRTLWQGNVTRKQKTVKDIWHIRRQHHRFSQRHALASVFLMPVGTKTDGKIKQNQRIKYDRKT